MAGANVYIGTGTTIAFATSGFTAEIMSVRWSGISRATIDTSHMAVATPGANQFGNRSYCPGTLVDPGELSLEVHFNPNTNLPVHGVAETITVTWPLLAADLTAAAWAGSGFVTAFEITDPLDDKMTATMTVKLTDQITMTDAT